MTRPYDPNHNNPLDAPEEDDNYCEVCETTPEPGELCECCWIGAEILEDKWKESRS